MIWLYLVVLWITWYPFVPRVGDPELQVLPSLSMLAVGGNLLLFAPIGALLGLFGQGTVGNRVSRAAAVTMGLSLAVEAGQWFIERRNPSPYDVLLNTGGAAFAAVIAIRLSSRFPRNVLAAGASGAVFLAVLAHLAFAAVAVGRGGGLEGWDPNHFIVSGDEVGNERTYLGVVERAEVCAGDAAEQVCAGPEASSEIRRRLAETAMRTQRVSLAAHALSHSDEHDGPTRIVTFSAGPYLRNATLGQQGSALIFRVRTPLTGPNGNDVQFQLADGVPLGSRTEVAADFDRGVITVAAKAEGAESRGSFRPGLLQSWLLYRPDFLWLRPYLNVEVRSADRAAVVSAAVLFLPVGLLLGWRGGRRVAVAVVTGAALAAGSLYAADALMVRQPEAAQLLVAAATAGAGVLLGRWDRARAAMW